MIEFVAWQMDGALLLIAVWEESASRSPELGAVRPESSADSKGHRQLAVLPTGRMCSSSASAWQGAVFSHRRCEENV